MRKEVFESIIITIIIVLGLGIAGYTDTHGTVYGEVTEVSDDLVIFSAGESEWSFYGDGFTVGDCIKATIEDNGTLTVSDDRVIGVKIVESR